MVSFVAGIQQLLGVTLQKPVATEGSVIITGEVVAGVLNATLRDSMCSSFVREQLRAQFAVRLVLVGRYGLPTNLLASGNVFNPRYNKVYEKNGSQGGHTLTQDELQERAGGGQQKFWVGALDDGRTRGGAPYFCPEGWTRVALRVDNFDARYSDWNIVYHGTKQESIVPILSSMLRAGPRAAYGLRVYVTPSIQFAAQNRYSEWYDIPTSDGSPPTEQVQFVLQCRVDPGAVERRAHATGTWRNGDPNFDDATIIWTIVPDAAGGHVTTAKIVCYGIMMRKRPRP